MKMDLKFVFMMSDANLREVLLSPLWKLFKKRRQHTMEVYINEGMGLFSIKLTCKIGKDLFNHGIYIKCFSRNN